MRVFDGQAPVTIVTTDGSSQTTRDTWRAAGAEVIVCGRDSRGVILDELLAALGKRDIQSLLVEGGSRIAGSFIGDSLVDKIVLFMAPKFLGGAEAPSVLAETGFTSLSQAVSLDISDVTRVGEDIRVEAYVHRDN